MESRGDFPLPVVEEEVGERMRRLGCDFYAGQKPSYSVHCVQHTSCSAHCVHSAQLLGALRSVPSSCIENKYLVLAKVPPQRFSIAFIAVEVSRVSAQEFRSSGWCRSVHSSDAECRPVVVVVVVLVVVVVVP